MTVKSQNCYLSIAHHCLVGEFELGSVILEGKNKGKFLIIKMLEEPFLGS